MVKISFFFSGGISGQNDLNDAASVDAAFGLKDEHEFDARHQLQMRWGGYG